jgi:hypothetical protein
VKLPGEVACEHLLTFLSVLLPLNLVKLLPFIGVSNNLGAFRTRRTFFKTNTREDIMSIANFVLTALELIEKNRNDVALSLTCSAVDATARKMCPLGFSIWITSCGHFISLQ